MSTNLPAKDLLALADRAVRGECAACGFTIPHSNVDADRGHVCGLNERCKGPVEFTPTQEAYRAARSASPVTLEEQMLIMGNRFENDQLTLEQEEEWARTTREHARRLAGEGGGQ